jgi:hypothetical protein
MTTNQQIRTIGLITLFIGLFGVLFTMINIPNTQGDRTIEMYEKARESYLAVWAWSTAVCFMGFGVIRLGKEN